MKKYLIFAAVMLATSAHGYQLKTSRELGAGDARNQNIVVQCTTISGGISNQTCAMRRYVRCSQTSTGKQSCNGWQEWRDIRNPGKKYSDWRSAATDCCREKGLR